MSTINDNGDLVLSRNSNHIPKPSIVEHRIRTVLEEQLDPIYVELMLDTMTVDSCDADNLIIRVDSPLQHSVITKKLKPAIEQIVADFFNIHPVVSIVLTE